jgi:Type-F conjugative transfer system protein (TrbI_Ftype)
MQQTVPDPLEVAPTEPMSRETIERAERVYETDGKDLMRVRFEPVRTFAGFRVTSIVFVSVIAALVAWNAWLTREVVTLNRQKIVSVSLASIITDFVRDQSHASGSPDEAAARTKLYLVATQKALLDLARNGTPVLASEAVLGNSVPDHTAQVKATVAKALADQPGQH